MAEGRTGGSRPEVDRLLAQVARGNTEALAAVCDQVAGPVYGLVNHIVGDTARAEAVTEEVLLEVWRTASRFDPAAASGLAWIVAIAQRRAGQATGSAVPRQLSRRDAHVSS